jgi:tRNA (guanosine-2'-O-)-methyltransferase
VSGKKTDIDLLNHLLEFVSDNKRNKFDEIIRFRTRYLTIVLEDIYQPHNASAVLRSCDCFGIQDVHIIENSNKYEVNPDVALGSSKWLSMHKYNSAEHNTPACLDKLKSQGYKIVAATPHENGCLLDELPLDQKTALVFGTEMQGLTPIALEMSDAFVKIPMYGFTESFNISVSAALSLYHLTEKLRRSDIHWQLDKNDMLEVRLSWARQVVKNADLIESRYLKQQ